MVSVKSRLFRGKDDVEAIIKILLADRSFERYPGPTDLREALAQPTVQENTRLWLQPDGNLVAYAYVDPYHNLRFEIASASGHQELETQIVNWGFSCVQRQAAEGLGSPSLDANCHSEDHDRLSFLSRYGFVKQEFETHHLSRSLLTPVTEPNVPTGFSIRPLFGSKEVDDWVALHRAAFGTKTMNAAERLAMMGIGVENINYYPELDLVATAPDGRLVAYVFCSIEPQQTETGMVLSGYTDPIAVHPDFQRRGLGVGMLLTGLLRLKASGAMIAHLSTSSQNSAMQKTASAAGFSLQSRSLWFSKEIADKKPGT